jgi:hypothetical protein|tara:strand:- start:1650 stop:2057 length:408 start_codon:yes stop_codon:yes gene_type:complete
MKHKNTVRRVFNNYFNLRVRISAKEVDQSIMKKSLFLNIIKKLKEIEERRDFMQDEIGMDMTTYEDKFFQVIEDLFKLNFNKPQISLIQAYIYEATRPDDWDGTVTLEVSKSSTKTYDLKTPEQLWSVVQLLGKE